MADELTLSDIAVMPSGQLTEEEKDQYNGTKTEIATVVAKKKQVPFGEKFGEMLPEGQTREMGIIEVETKPIGINALGQPITVREEFPLKKHPVTGKYVYSLHEKSKTHKLFKLLKINKFEEAIGKTVVIVKRVRQSGTTYLGLSI